MARKKIDTTVWGKSNQLDPLSNNLVFVGQDGTMEVFERQADGSNGAQATVYSGATGAGTLSQPIDADVNGRFPGWVERGVDYNNEVTLGGSTVTEPFDAPETSGAPADAIAEALADAKGDLIVADAADSFIRLAVGSNGRPLVADSSTSSGLAYSDTLTINSTGMVAATDAMTDRVWSDTAHGDALYHYAESYDGARYEVRQGTAAAPVTARGPMVKYSRYVNLNTGGTLDGTEASPWALLSSVIEASSTTQAQPVAIFGHAVTSSTATASYPNVNPDATAIIGIARVKASGTGLACGGFFRGLVESSTASAHTTGVEAQTVNNSGGDYLWTDTIGGANGVGSRAMGLWIASGGANRSAVAIQIGKLSSPGWDVGIGFTGAGGQGNAVVTASIRDDGNATTSVDIRGTHTYALTVGGTGGRVSIGSTTSTSTNKVHIGLSAAGDSALNLQAAASQTGHMLRCSDSSAVLNFAIGSSGYLHFVEQADPAAGATNSARLYAKDNGAGKTQLAVRFPTGAVQILATEP